MTLRATIAITVTVALSFLGLGYLYTRERDTAQALVAEKAALAAQVESLTAAQKQAQERFKSDRKVLIAREARKASEARILAQQNQTLQNALQAHKAWNDTDVPTRVREALSGPENGLRGDSTGPLSDGLRE